MQLIAQRLAIAIGAGALLLATAGFTGAQETTPNQNGSQDQTQLRKAVSNGQGQAEGTQQQAGATRRFGPGDGSGNQGVKPQDGSGNGSPGRHRASSIAVKDRGGTNGKGSKAGRGNSGTRGSSQGALTRSRTRNPSSAGGSSGSGARYRRGNGSSNGSGGCRR